jgi:hypothetical protein
MALPADVGTDEKTVYPGVTTFQASSDEFKGIAARGHEDSRLLMVLNCVWDTENLAPKLMEDINLGGNPLKEYCLSDYSDPTATTIYIGCTRTDAAWVIKRLDTTTYQMRYAKGASGYNFANRAALGYDTYDNVF